MLKPILAGRSNELKTLDGLLEIVFGGKGTLVLISGEAGIGKTRLSEEFGHNAVSKGFSFYIGRCIPGIPIPFQPFREALMKFSDFRDEKSIGAGLSGFLNIKRKENTVDVNENETILFKVLDILKKASREKPIVLLIEDVQWADIISIQMLHFFARNSNGLRVMIIATYRPEEVLAKSNGEKHPLLENLQIMRREKICEEIALDRLTPSELRIAIEGMLNHKIDDWLLNRIAMESGGNPLFAEETIKLLAQSGEIVETDGRWVAKDRTTLSIPSAVKDVITRRLQSTPRSHLKLLEIASVYGMLFDTGLFEETLRMGRLETFEMMEDLEDIYQLIQANDGRYGFKHELVKNVCYDQISLPRKKELHRVVANYLENKRVDAPSFGILSNHFRMCGMDDKALEYCVLAADISFQEAAYVDSLSQYKTALSIAGENPSFLKKKLYSLERLGDAYHNVLRDGEAVIQYRTLLDKLDNDQEKARIYVKLAHCWGPYGLGKGNFSKAMEFLQMAESYPSLIDKNRADIASFKATLHFYKGNFMKSIALSSEAETLYEKLGDTAQLISELCTHASSNICIGEIRTALTHIEKARALYSGSSHTQGRKDIEITTAMAYFHAGRYNEALSILKQMSTEDLRVGAYDRIIHYTQMSAFINDSQDRFVEALAEARNCCNAAHKIEGDYWRLRACITMSHMLIRTGEYEQAQEKCKELRELFNNYQWEIPSLQRGLAEVVLAELAALKGEWRESNVGFEKSLDILQMSVYGMLFSAMVHKWFGDSLIRQGNRLDGLWHYEGALRLYKKMENDYQVKKLEALLSLY